MISTPDGSFSPTSIQPSPRSQVAPLCLVASGLQQSYCLLYASAAVLQRLCLLFLSASLAHTLWIQTSPAPWRTRKEMLVKIPAIFGWFLEPKFASIDNSPVLQQGMGFTHALHSSGSSGRHQESSTGTGFAATVEVYRHLMMSPLNSPLRVTALSRSLRMLYWDFSSSILVLPTRGDVQNSRVSLEP